MFCKKCGMKIEDDSKFCSECGCEITRALTENIDDSIEEKETIKKVSSFSKNLFRVCTIVLLLIIVATIIASIIGISGSKDSGQSEDLTQPSFYQSNNENTNDTDSTTKTNYSQWGFSNPTDWGNQMVQIQSTDNQEYIYSDSNGKYVIIKEGTHHWEFRPESGQFLAGSKYTSYFPKNVDINSYTVLDNERISVVEPWDSYVLQITDRIVEDDVPIFEVLNVNSNVYMIPHSWLDPIKPAEFYQEGKSYGNESFDYYKFYLK